MASVNAPEAVQELVDRFERNVDAYRSGRYNETQVRLEFINPMFAALGWDMDNEKGWAEAYKDVIHEDAIKVGGATKAPDYCFRIGGTRKFFLEAKKPSVSIKDEPSPAFQLRRYAWSAKLPLSILTDFEELAVYDCRIKPAVTDKPSTARTMYIRYPDYPARWDEIASTFSYDAVGQGSFDKYAESTKRKKGTAEVDAAFLKDIEAWRDMLARNIALRNPGLSQRELNFAVQRTIDRIIFLRICEDRHIESYGQLMALLNGSHVYERLAKVFRDADDRYNSGLFYFRREKGREDAPDELSLSISIDDKPLKDIIKTLYYPESPYEFSVLPADILGQVYEQFLGKVIRLTPGHHAVVEDKPEVKKAGGVYYTPTYIVDYIVKHTVGKLVDGKRPGPRGGVSKLRILDPACGSGSFLIGAYQYLLDWHRDRYVEDGPDKWATGANPALYQASGGHWRLTTGERRRILLNNIYGVDIDPQAVEVTKLSLLLKVLEGESEQTLAAQLRLFHERALPDLANNIKCGNSLIGPDFYQGRQMSLLDDEERYRINVFDWEAEFPEVFNRQDAKDAKDGEEERGGFDAVIGNPPYGVGDSAELKNYIVSHFQATEGRFDRYELFIERGIRLCKQNGMLGYIVPSPLLTNLYARMLRQYILENCALKEITNFGMDVFADPTIHTCILIIGRHRLPSEMVAVRKQVSTPNELQTPYDYEVAQEALGNNERKTFDVFVDPEVGALLAKLQSLSRPLGDICFIRQCIKTGDDRTHVRAFEQDPGDPWKPTLRGRSIMRYATIEHDLWLRYGPWLARNWKNSSFYERPKIVVRETGSRITASLDCGTRYVLSSLYAVYPRSDQERISLSYLLGVLNSNLATYFMKMIALNITKGAFTKVRTNQLARLPIRRIDFSAGNDKSRHDQMVSLVDQMLALHKQLAAAKTGHDKTALQRQIDATDVQIDRLVYELYDLTEDEIKIVEDATA